MPRSKRRNRTFTPQNRVRMVELHAEGLALNEIARRMGFAASTISKHAKAAGLLFDRSQTKAATAAVTADLAAMRAELAHELLVKSRRFLDALDKPFLVFNFGGKDNTYEEHTLDGPPTGDIRNLMTSTGIALQRSLELSRFDADPNEGAAAVDSWLDHMTGRA